MATRRATKTPKKLAPKSATPRGRPFPKGERVAGQGRGPKKGAKNAGRPPEEIRALCREEFSTRVSLLAAFADDEKNDVGTRIKALDMLAKYGIGTTITPTDGDGRGITRFTMTIGEGGHDGD